MLLNAIKNIKLLQRGWFFLLSNEVVRPLWLECEDYGKSYRPELCAAWKSLYYNVDDTRDDVI